MTSPLHLLPPLTPQPLSCALMQALLQHAMLIRPTRLIRRRVVPLALGGALGVFAPALPGILVTPTAT